MRASDIHCDKVYDLGKNMYETNGKYIKDGFEHIK